MGVAWGLIVTDAKGDELDLGTFSLPWRYGQMLAAAGWPARGDGKADWYHFTAKRAGDLIPDVRLVLASLRATPQVFYRLEEATGASYNRLVGVMGEFLDLIERWPDVPVWSDA